MSILPDWLSSTPPKREAAEQLYGKATKLQTALEAVLTNSFRWIDLDEHETVRQYRDMKLFGKQQRNLGGPSNNDLIVADNVDINTSGNTVSTVLPWVLAALAGAALWWVTNGQEGTPAADTDTRYEITPLPGE